MSIQLNFTKSDWDRVKRDWTSWWRHDLDRPMVVIERLPGQNVAPELMPEVKATIDFPLHTPAEQVIDYYSELLEQTRYFGDAFPRWYPDMSPGFIAAFLGAEVLIRADTVWLEPPNIVPIEELSPVYDERNPWWEWIKSLTAEGVKRWANK
jgi:hypothetical protein